MNKQLLMRIALVLLMGIGIVFWIIHRDMFTWDGLEAWLGALGIWGPMVYIALYLVAPSLLVPGLAITLVAGALFGPVWGTLYVVIGSVGGATLAFLVARYLAADWVERKAGGILRQVKEGVEAEGWRFVAFVRLVPLFPFNLLNYVLGLTRVPLRTYVVTSAICMFPGTVGYVYLGYAGRETLVGGENLVQKISIAVGVFAALVFLPLLVRRLRNAKRARASSQTAAPASGAEGETRHTPSD